MINVIRKIFQISNIKSFYARYESRIGGITLLVGFIVDNITVSSVGLSTQTYIFGAYIALAGVAILGLHFIESRDNKRPKLHFWFFLLFQFAIGSLFSMFFAFYSRSSSFANSWPFLLILFLMMIGSEIWKKHYLRLSLQVSLYFISVFSFSIYIVPIIFHKMSLLTFIIGGILSLFIISVFVKLLKYISKKRFKEWQTRIILGVGAIYLILNFLYFTGAIPPVPLFMRKSGVYHSLQWDGVSSYIVYGEDKSWINAFNPFPTFHKGAGDPIYAVTSVFAPTELKATIIHDWQRYDSENYKWVSVTKVRVPIIGGREAGYRTYSMKQNVTPGKWRVDIKTDTGQIIGRIRFRLMDSVIPNLKQDKY